MKNTVTFLPDNVTIEVDNGENLLSAAAKAGLYIQASCGGDGVCGKCKVKIEQGEVAANKAMQLKDEEHAAGFRLACQSSIIQDLVVFIPAATSKDGKALKAETQDHPLHPGPLAGPPHRHLAGSTAGGETVPFPDPPTLEDNVPDLQRSMAEIFPKRPLMWSRWEEAEVFYTYKSGQLGEEEFPTFYKRLRYHLLETAPHFLKEQKVRLYEYEREGKVFWLIPEALTNGEFKIEGCFLSNELVDAFPVHRVVFDQGSLKEIWVNHTNDQLGEEPRRAFCWAPAFWPSEKPPRRYENSSAG